jgi:hypothetical protein
MATIVNLEQPGPEYSGLFTFKVWQILTGNGVSSGPNSAFITGVTPGTASAGKSLVTNNSNNISGINQLSATSLVTTNLTQELETILPVIGVKSTAGFAGLSSAGKVNLKVAADGTAQYRLWALTLDYGGTNFSGVGGDRNLSVTDGTQVYSTIPAASLTTLPGNVNWGSTALPFPAILAQSSPTVAGANLYLQYSGGTTDYTAGSITVSALLIKVTN